MNKLIHKLPASIIWLAFILMPFLAMAGGLGIAPMAFLMGLAGWIVLFRLGETRLIIRKPWFWSFAILLLWCCLAQLWSPYASNQQPGNALKLLILVLSYFGVMTVFKVLNPNLKHILRHVFMASGVLAIGLFFIEILSNYNLSSFFDPLEADETLRQRKFDAEKNLGRGILTYVQFLPALCLMFAAQFKKGIWVSLILVLITLICSILNNLLLPPLVIMLTGIVMGLAWAFPKWCAKTLLIGLICLTLSAPLIGFWASHISDEALLSMPLSLEHRLRMWAYCWEQITLNPWFGNGFDASRTYQDTFVERGGYEMVIVSLHPHNSAIQIWLELGAIGAFIASATLAFLIKPAVDFVKTPLRSSALCGTITAAALFGLTTIGAWQFWWIGSIFIAIAILNLCPRLVSDKTSI